MDPGKGRAHLNLHDADELFDGVDRSLQRGTLIPGEFELDDLFRAARPQLDGHADEKTADTVLAVQPHGTGKNLLAVEHDGIDHFGDRRRGRVVGAARLQQVDDLGTAVAGALDDGLDALRWNQGADGDAGAGAHACQWHHRVPVAAEDIRLHITHRDLELLRDEGAKARRVQDAGHPDYALPGKFADLERQLRHGVERVADDDENGVGRSAHELLGHAADDVLVGFHEVVPGHAGLAGHAGGDHADARPGRLLVAIGSDDGGVIADDRAGLQQVEGLSLGQAFNDVDQHEVGVATLGKALGQGGADVAGPHDRDLGT